MLFDVRFDEGLSSFVQPPLLVEFLKFLDIYLLSPQLRSINGVAMRTKQHDSLNSFELEYKGTVPLPTDFTIPGYFKNTAALSLAD